MERTYPKIHRLEKEEVDNILDYELVVQSKIDGANARIWYDNKLRLGSRSRTLNDDESFNGFREYVEANDKVFSYLKDNPTHILYGEWLVPHSIKSYNPTAYKQFYLFDIYDTHLDAYMNQEAVEQLANSLDLRYPKVFAKGKLTLEEIVKHVGECEIGPEGEGVVLKAPLFVNKFGDNVYAKITTQKFKESNAITFGGNNKHSETYWEQYVCNKYCTVARVEKIIQKLQSQTDKRLSMEHTSQVANTAYHDLITEEIWDIQKKVPKLDFKNLKRICIKKNIQIYHGILNNMISVADMGR